MLKRAIEWLLWRTTVLGRVLGGGHPGNSVHRATLRFASFLGARLRVSMSSVVATFVVPVDANRVEFLREVSAAENRLRTRGISVRREEHVVTRTEAKESPVWQTLLPSLAESDAEATVVVELHVAPAEYWNAFTILRTEEYPTAVSTDT